ncbi:HNH endonuclease, partial [Gulosibacter molinativorax]
MAVTKRTLFEVLRRDAHACQYCGAQAPDVKLHIDHVVPVALGGSDKPDNLVTACSDCNTGKTSIAPDSPFASAVSEKAAAYALAMQDHMVRFRASLEALDDYVDEFEAEWNSWTSNATGRAVPLPPDYRASLYRWQQLG